MPTRSLSRRSRMRSSRPNHLCRLIAWKLLCSTRCHSDLRSTENESTSWVCARVLPGWKGLCQKIPPRRSARSLSSQSSCVLWQFLLGIVSWRARQRRRISGGLQRHTRELRRQWLTVVLAKSSDKCVRERHQPSLEHGGHPDRSFCSRSVGT